jgi:hypothetical protein
MDALTARPHWLALPLLAVALAGCGSSGSSSSGGGGGGLQTLGNIIAFQSTTPPPVMDLPPEGQDELSCPEVIIADGGAAMRSQSGPDSSSLRHQISILKLARECNATGGGGFTLKVGVEGRVLLGPAGSPGGHFATLETRVLRGTTVVARRAARVGGNIASGQGGTDFSHVEQGIAVPPGRGDVEIIVSLNPGGATQARARRR